MVKVDVCLTGQPRSMYLSDPTTEEDRKRLSEEQIGLTCLDRERDAYIRYVFLKVLFNI